MIFYLKFQYLRTNEKLGRQENIITLLFLCASTLSFSVFIDTVFCFRFELVLLVKKVFMNETFLINVKLFSDACLLYFNLPSVRHFHIFRESIDLNFRCATHLKSLPGKKKTDRDCFRTQTLTLLSILLQRIFIYNLTPSEKCSNYNCFIV